jgi:hypothetical protein
LIDTANNKVLYGTEAILDILVGRAPWLGTLYNLPLMKHGIKVVYKLISYNRRTIVAPAAIQKQGFDCTPDFSIKYRSLFCLLGLCIGYLSFFPVYQLLSYSLFFSVKGANDAQIAFSVFLIGNVALSIVLKGTDALEYLGQLGVLAIIASLLSLPLIGINSLFGLSHTVVVFWVVAASFVLIREYIRRMQFAGITKQPGLIAANVLGLITLIVYLIK